MREPQQARSRETLRRLLRAARSVIGEEGFERAAIASIVERAGVSTGAFYKRFDSKDALLHAIHQETVEHNLAAMRRTFDPERWEGKSAVALLEEWIRGSFQVSRRDAGFQRACFQRALSDPAFAQREARLRREAAELLSALLLERLPNPRRREVRQAVDYCLTMVTAVFTDVVVTERFPAVENPLPKDELARRLLTSCCAQLGLRVGR